jgi:purine-binding chemotaxis protein CheW
VERIVRMVEIAVAPKAPEVVHGLINIEGRIVPVFDLRKRFRLPWREPGLSDHLIIARTKRRLVAVAADRVTGVIPHGEQETIAAKEILPGLGYVEGVVKEPDGLIFIHDLDSFLSTEEEAVLERALTEP